MGYVLYCIKLHCHCETNNLYSTLINRKRFLRNNDTFPIMGNKVIRNKGDTFIHYSNKDVNNHIELEIYATKSHLINYPSAQQQLLGR